MTHCSDLSRSHYVDDNYIRLHPRTMDQALLFENSQWLAKEKIHKELRIYDLAKAWRVSG